MKNIIIEWTGETVEVPKIGMISAGDIRTVECNLGMALISQGMAIEVKPKKKREG